MSAVCLDCTHQVSITSEQVIVPSRSQKTKQNNLRNSCIWLMKNSVNVEGLWFSVFPYISLTLTFVCVCVGAHMPKPFLFPLFLHPSLPSHLLPSQFSLLKHVTVRLLVD